MTREDMFALAKKHGYKPGKPLRAAKRKAVEGELRAFFADPDGRQALEDAPREHIAEKGEDKYRRVTADRAVALLMEELT